MYIYLVPTVSGNNLTLAAINPRSYAPSVRMYMSTSTYHANWHGTASIDPTGEVLYGVPAANVPITAFTTYVCNALI